MVKFVVVGYWVAHFFLFFNIHRLIICLDFYGEMVRTSQLFFSLTVIWNLLENASFKTKIKDLVQISSSFLSYFKYQPSLSYSRHGAQLSLSGAESLYTDSKLRPRTIDEYLVS